MKQQREKVADAKSKHKLDEETSVHINSTHPKHWFAHRTHFQTLFVNLSDRPVLISTFSSEFFCGPVEADHVALHPPSPPHLLRPPSQAACSVMQVTAQEQRDDNTGQLVRGLHNNSSSVAQCEVWDSERSRERRGGKENGAARLRMKDTEREERGGV